MTYGWGQSGSESLWDRMCVRERSDTDDQAPGGQDTDAQAPGGQDTDAQAPDDQAPGGHDTDGQAWGRADRSPTRDNPADRGDPPTREELMNNPEELEALEALGDEIAVLSAHQSVLEYERMAKIAVFDRRGGWQIGGYRNCADWLACRAGLSRGAARERVRVARALVDLPQISRAMAAGALSFSQVRALTRVATPENDGDLVAFAQDTTAAQLEQMVRGWKLLDTKSEEDLERRRHAARSLSVFPDSNGMYRVQGVVTAEVGALLSRGIEAGSDELYAVERREALEEETTPEQRRADAIGLLVERAMAVGFGRPRVSAETRTKRADRMAEAKGESGVDVSAETRMESPMEAPDSNTKRDAHVSAETPRGRPGFIAEPGDPAGDPGDPGEESDARSAGDPASGSGCGSGCGSGTGCGCGCEAPISGTRAERYQVMLHVDLNMLRAVADEPNDVATRSDHLNGAGARNGNGASGTSTPTNGNGTSASDPECIGSPCTTTASAPTSRTGRAFPRKRLGG